MRRRFLRLCAGATAWAAFRPAGARAEDSEWAIFKRRFIPSGERVVDTGNEGVTHSESQGWGMLFAEANNDRETFDKIWKWTRTTLRRDDSLFSWRWLPHGTVPDKNNASDGDVLIAWALARAAKRWDAKDYARESSAIQEAVLEFLVEEVKGRLILLPGLRGFARKELRVVNLSYYVWTALQAFGEAGGEKWRAQWRRVHDDGLWLLDQAAFGTLNLPPDWLLYGDKEVQIADGWPPYFGFDAVRIPLYLAWHNDGHRLARFLAAWRTPRFNGRPPAWINLRDGSVSPYAGPGGYTAIFALSQYVGDGFKTDRPAMALVDADDYYSASLKLLSAMAAREAPGSKRP